MISMSQSKFSYNTNTKLNTEIMLDDDSNAEKNLNKSILIEDCYIYSWGKNNCGQLGNGSICDYVNTPKAAKSSTALYIQGDTTISIGGKHSLILDEGKVYSCGSDLFGVLGTDNLKWKKFANFQKIEFFDDKQIIKVESAEFHNLALTSEGHIYAWGGNLHNVSLKM